MKKQVIILAGGAGNRFGTKLPKQFLSAKGKAIFLYSVDQFYSYDPTIKFIIVVPAIFVRLTERLIRNTGQNYSYQLVPGGERRYDSVKNGLEHASADGLIAIHDGARPAISAALIKRVFKEASEHNSAIPVIGVNDSVRLVKNDENEVIDRGMVYLVQTPQCFRASLIKKAYMGEFSESFTDDASVFEALGLPVHLIPGENRNIKITSPEDLRNFRNILKIKNQAT